MESWILQVSFKVNVKPFGLHLLCKRPKYSWFHEHSKNWIHFLKVNMARKCHNHRLQGRVVQSVTCLTADACLTVDPRVARLIPARFHIFVESDHEIISTVIIHPLIHSRRVVHRCCQLQTKVCALGTG